MWECVCGGLVGGMCEVCGGYGCGIVCGDFGFVWGCVGMGFVGRTGPTTYAPTSSHVAQPLLPAAAAGGRPSGR